MGMKYAVGTKHANWTVLRRVDKGHFECVCSNCERVAVVTRICLIRNTQLKAIGCRSCRSGRGAKRKVIDGKTECCGCKQVLPLSEFNKHSRNTFSKIGSYCRTCNREYKLQKEYGLSIIAYNELVAASGGRCNICQRKTSGLVIDHDHKRKSVRGILCQKCNSGLGFFCDNTKIMERAIQYLRGVDL